MEISSMPEVPATEADSKGKVTLRGATLEGSDVSISREEKDFYKFMFGDDIASVRYRKLHCTACDVHIGSAPGKASSMFEHPTLRVLLCAKCRKFYGDGTFEQGEDATDMFCRWCANGGNLYCCSYCSNTFCNKCIKRNFDPLVRKKIEDDEKWKCFVCDPADLYSARAVCWALLQHVQIVTRILQNDKIMTKEEIQEKMNLDESRCCPRRRKAKRRRTSSNNSDEDDETYVPGIDELPLSTVKRKMTRKSNISPIVTNGIPNHSIPQTVIPIQTAVTIPTKRKDISELEDDPPLSLITCEQTMIECENETVITENMNVPSPPTPPLPVIENQLAQPTMHVNPIPTANLLQKVPTLAPVAVVSSPPVRRMRRSCPQNANKYLLSGEQSLQSTLVQTPKSSMYSPAPIRPHYASPNVPMVAIPATSALQHKRPRVLLPKPTLLAKRKLVSEPSVIEINSDSDESIVVEPSSSGNSNVKRNHPAARTHARTCHKLATTEPEIREATIQTEVDRSNNMVVEEIALQTTEVNALLFALRAKLRKLPIIDAPNESELSVTRIKTRRFHLAIAKTISSLSDINDKVVHKYNNWRRSQLEVKNVNNNNKSDSEVATSYSEFSLDMSCTRDSDSDPEDENNGSDNMMIMDKLLSIKSFQERDTVDVTVGNHISTEDKAVQVYDVLNRDYEKCIGHSVLTKVDYDETDKEEVAKPVKVPAEHFGKFEEQFIFHLQHIEEHGIGTEDTKGLPDPNETPLKDLIEANSPFISEMLESIGSPMTNGVRTEEQKQGSGVNGENKENTEINGAKKVVEELDTVVVTGLSDDLYAHKQLVVDDTADGVANIKEKRQQQVSDIEDSEEADIAVRSLMEEDERRRASMEETIIHRVYLDSDDECTIID